MNNPEKLATLCLACLMLPVSLEYPFFIATSDFSNAYILRQCIIFLRSANFCGKFILVNVNTNFVLAFTFCNLSFVHCMHCKSLGFFVPVLFIGCLIKKRLNDTHFIYFKWYSHSFKPFVARIVFWLFPLFGVFTCFTCTCISYFPF